MQRLAILLAFFTLPPSAHAECSKEATDVQQALAQHRANDLPKLLTPELRPSFPAPRVQKAYDALPGAWGPLNNVGAAVPMQKDGRQLAIVPLTYAGGQVNLVVACDANQMVNGIHFVPAHGSLRE